MINNLYVVGTTQKLIEEELKFLNKKVEGNIQEEKQKLALQKKTPWGQLTNPKTKIGHFFEEYGEIVATGGIVIDVASLVVLLISGSVFIGSECVRNREFSKQIEEWIKVVLNYAKYPFFATLPVILASSLKSSLMDKFHVKEIEIKRISKLKNERVRKLEMVLSVLKDMEKNTDEYFLIRDFLESVNLNGNEEEYNKDLIILLADATTNPTIKTFKALAQHLRTSILNQNAPSNPVTQDFLQNQFVKEIVKTY